MENDIKVELEDCDKFTESYWRDLDRFDNEMDWDKYQEELKNSFAELLKGELGTDIQNVTTGKVKVKLPFKVKIKRWFERFFKMFE